MDSPSGGAPEQAPRWDLVGTEGCGSGIRFLAPYLIVWGYIRIYRRKEYVGGATGGPRGWRARLVGVGASPTSWPPLFFLDIGSKSLGSCSLRKSRSRSFIPFGLRLVFLFCEAKKQGKNRNWHWALG